MARTTITAAQTDADSPLNQVLFDAFRGNDADHQARINVLEVAGSVFVYLGGGAYDPSGLIAGGIGVDTVITGGVHLPSPGVGFTWRISGQAHQANAGIGIHKLRRWLASTATDVQQADSAAGAVGLNTLVMNIGNNVEFHGWFTWVKFSDGNFRAAALRAQVVAV